MNWIRYGCLMLLAVSVGVEASAQIEKGTQFWGGTVSGSGSFSSSENENGAGSSSKNDLELRLQGGVFTKSNFMVGVGAQGSFYPETMETNAMNSLSRRTNTTSIYSLVPFVRWYKPLNERFSLFLEPSLSAGFRFSRNTSSGGFGESRSTGEEFRSSLNVVPGISYRLGKRFALEADVNILRLGLDFNSGKDYSSFRFASSVSSGINSYFGLRGAFYLN